MSDLPCDTESDPSWEYYPSTILRFSTGLSIDLTKAIAKEDQHKLLQLGLVSPFAVLTARNPRGRNLPAIENQQRHLELVAAIEGSEQWVPVDGVAFDGNHAEESIAVRITRAEARILARRFDQTAFFWYDGSAFWIDPGCAEFAPIKLPQQRLLSDG